MHIIFRVTYFFNGPYKYIHCIHGIWHRYRTQVWIGASACECEWIFQSFSLSQMHSSEVEFAFVLRSYLLFSISNRQRTNQRQPFQRLFIVIWIGACNTHACTHHHEIASLLRLLITHTFVTQHTATSAHTPAIVYVYCQIIVELTDSVDDYWQTEKQ